MTAVILGLHLIVAVAMVFLVLMQRSEGGALGMGGGSNSLMSGRGAADALAKGTGALAAVFFLTSLSLTLMAGGAKTPTSVVDRPASSFPVDFSAIPATISQWISGFQTTSAKPASPAPAPVAPTTEGAPTEPAALTPLPETAPATTPSGDVVPAPVDSMTRAAPLPDAKAPTPVVAAKPAPVAAKPAALAAASATPAARPAAAAARTAPASVSKPASSTAPAAIPAESSEPQTPAAQPRGRAGPDE